MEEAEHLIQVLKTTRKALLSNDALQLKELSNQTIHCATSFQDAGSITIAVLVYSLSKIIERKEQIHIKNWNVFVKRCTGFLDLAIKAVQENNSTAFESHLASARASLASISINLKPYIEEVLKKASINKAGRIYEHGISLGQTAKLLGVSQWELAEYTGQTKTADIAYNATLNIKKRANMALDFFS